MCRQEVGEIFVHVDPNHLSGLATISLAILTLSTFQSISWIMVSRRLGDPDFHLTWLSLQMVCEDIVSNSDSIFDTSSSSLYTNTWWRN